MIHVLRTIMVVHYNIDRERRLFAKDFIAVFLFKALWDYTFTLIPVFLIPVFPILYQKWSNLHISVLIIFFKWSKDCYLEMFLIQYLKTHLLLFYKKPFCTLFAKTFCVFLIQFNIFLKHNYHVCFWAKTVFGLPFKMFSHLI